MVQRLPKQELMAAEGPHVPSPADGPAPGRAHTIQAPEGLISLTAFEIQSIQSADLFRSSRGENAHWSSDLSSLCRTRWADFTTALVALPEQVVFFLVLGGASRTRAGGYLVVAAGRGKRADSAEAESAKTASALRRLMAASRDYAEFESVADARRQQ